MSTTRENNFNAIRILAAFMVIAGHMGILRGGGETPQFLQQDVHSLGVKILFLVGGYFIALSWENDSCPLRYMVKRLFRIYPPLVITILFSAFIIGPWITTLDLKSYLAHPGTMMYVTYNLRMYPIFILPGMFESNPYPNAVNGSLWTLPIEMTFYVVIPFLMEALKKLGEKAFPCHLTFTVVVCAFQLYHVVVHPEWEAVFYGTDWVQAINLFPFYMIGILFTFPQVKKCCNLQLATFLLLAASCVRVGIALNFLALYIGLPYFIFSFGLAENPIFHKVFSGSREISYGMYLYSFPIQQCVVYFAQKSGIYLSFLGTLLLAMIPIYALGYISHRYIEEPSLRFCKKFLDKNLQRTAL